MVDEAEYNKLVSEAWGKNSPDISKTFYGFPPVRDYLYSCVSEREGKTERDWVERWTVETYLSQIIPVENCLSLCCGFGEIERILADLGVFKHCTGIDISEGAVKGAIAKAKEGNYDSLDYVQSDVNSMRLEPENYELVWANGALHHIKNLEHVISEVYNSLKPGGYFVTNEYIGPKHQQLPSRQREIVNSVIHMIPPRLRHSSEEMFALGEFTKSSWRSRLSGLHKLVPVLRNGIGDFGQLIDSVKWPLWKKGLVRGGYGIFRNLFGSRATNFRYGKVWDVNSFHFKQMDPSEGIRSDEIIPILKKTFDWTDIRYYNGSVLLYALDKKFYDEFDASREEDRLLLDMLINIEKTLIKMGELASDHAHIVAGKRGKEN